VLRQGKLLCVKLKPYKDSLKNGVDYWCLPGGGLDENEPLIAGVTREMIEETGIPPTVGNLLYVQQFTYDNTEYLEFFFHITNAEDYTDIDLTKTTHGMEEIEEIAFVDPSSTRILPTFLQTEPLEEHAAAHAPTKIISLL